MTKYLKLFFYLLLIPNLLFALDISKKETPLHKKIELLQGLNSIEEAIEKKESFKEYEYFRRYLRKRKSNDNLWLKTSLTNSSSYDIKREVFTRWDNTIVTMYLVKDGKAYRVEELKEYSSFLRSKVFSLGAKETIDIYFNIKVKRALDDYYYLYFLSPHTAIDFIVSKEKYFHNGLLLGILIAMMMYNFFMYFSMKLKSYLYLGLYQSLIILYTSGIRSFLILQFENFPDFSFWFFKIGSSFFISILSILFTKEFLNTKKQMPRFDKLLTISIFALGIFQLNSIQHINYAAFLYSLYFIAGLYSFIKGNKAALFYILGFSGTIVYLMAINVIKYYELDINFEYQSAIQFLGVIEAFALSMALYLKVKSLVAEKEKAQKEVRESEKMLLIQSRFATMGEMIASIAHQWRQPLNHLTMIFANLQLADETKKLDTQYLNKKTKEANLQLKYMSDTIEDFSNFFSKKRTLESFSLEEVCKHSLELVESRCKKYAVEVYIQKDNFKMFANYKNELTQVLVIILNNAIDALMLNNIEDRMIHIKIKDRKIIISDNAGGIPQEIIAKIFDPYFSTKDKKFGTGLGLYTAKMIVDSLLKGKIYVKNIDDGASFFIEI